MKKVIASAGLLALGVVGVQSARADMAAGADKPWTISGTLRGFYDDNYNTVPDGPTRKGSFGFEVRPSASIRYSTGPTTLTASYTYALQYYVDRPGNKADQSHDFEFGLSHNFNERYSLGVTESFVSSQEPEVLDATLSQPFRANGDNLHNAAAATFSAQVTRLLGFVLSYSNDWWDYTGDALVGAPSYATLLNRFQHLVTLDSRWQIWPETVGILGYQFGAVDYVGHGDLRGINLPPAGAISPSSRNSYSHYVYVGADHSFRSDLTASVRVGAQFIDFYNETAGANASDLSPYAQLNVTYAYMDGGNVSLGFNHQHNATDQAFDNNTGTVTEDQESSTVFLSVTQVLKPLSPKLTANLTGQYQNSTFNGGGIDGETDDFYLFGFNLNYQFNHYLSTEVGYNYDLLNSDVNNRGFHRNRVYIGVTASY